MILIIDGYNLLKHIYPHEKGKLGKQRDKLIHQIGCYKSKKVDEIKEIVIVFDGGPWSHATRDISSGIVVIFSGRKKNADEWIIDYVERNKEKELMLVTRDRELIRQCKKQNVEVLSGVDFYEVAQKVVLEGFEQDLAQDKESGLVQKYEPKDTVKDEVLGNSEIDSESLDILMEQASVDLYKKEDKVPAGGKKKGRSHTLSKKEKKRISKLKKL